MSFEATLARRATGLLADFNMAGVLTAADVHVASRLGALVGEGDETVLLALALTVRGTRHGSVVLDLGTAATSISADADDGVAQAPTVELPWPTGDWAARCRASALLQQGPAVRMDGDRMWLDRYWRQEQLVATELVTRAADRPFDLDLPALAADLADLFPLAEDRDQKRAAAVAALSRVSVVAGGPGTGKTTTIARLLAVLQRQQPTLRIALAAPTGKAAARMEEAVRSAAGTLTPADVTVLASLTASTLHRLLGRRPGRRSRFWHDRANRLPYDVVVIDECSMVSLTLMARLLEALAPHTRLVLVGDPDQLASVEAGAVLGDLVDRDDAGPVTAGFAELLGQVLPDDVLDDRRAVAAASSLREAVVLLSVAHRFDGATEIAELAELIRRAQGPEALALLRSGVGGLSFTEVGDDLPVTVTQRLQRELLGYESAIITAARAGQVDQALEGLERHRLLCAHRVGVRGVRHWTTLVEGGLIGHNLVGDRRADGYYPGQPLLVTSNDYETGLYNGDTGIVIERDGKRLAVFRRGGDPIEVPLVRLSDVRPLHAMTVHRAQGSQFAHVTVLLPLASSPLATRETLYTAVTRAMGKVHVIGSSEAVLAAIAKPVARATGLRERLQRD